MRGDTRRDRGAESGRVRVRGVVRMSYGTQARFQTEAQNPRGRIDDRTDVGMSQLRGNVYPVSCRKLHLFQISWPPPQLSADSSLIARLSREKGYFLTKYEPDCGV